MKVKFKKLHPEAVIPFKNFDDDFCYDCVATSCEEIAPNVYKYGLGFSLEIVRERKNRLFKFDIDLRARSSVWKTGLVLSNSIGTIDEPYRGEISAVFYHVLPDMPIYKVGDRVCQIHVNRSVHIDFVESEELSKTDRGANGYGSTGN